MFTAGYTTALQSPQTPGRELPTMAPCAGFQCMTPSKPSLPRMDFLTPPSPRRGFFCPLSPAHDLSRPGPSAYKWRQGPSQTVTQAPCKDNRPGRHQALTFVHALTARDSPIRPVSPPWTGHLSTPPESGGVFFPGYRNPIKPSRAVTPCYSDETDLPGGAA